LRVVVAAVLSMHKQSSHNFEPTPSTLHFHPTSIMTFARFGIPTSSCLPLYIPLFSIR
jgi:hypothetical protein